MWRNHSFSDSDQSISDVDEEQDGGWLENCISLAGTSDQKKKVKLGVTSQLELLKGFRERDLGFSSDDEVEVPDFQKRNLDCKNDVGHDTISSKAIDSTSHPDGWTPNVKKGRKMLFKSATCGNNVSEMLELYTKENKKQAEPCNFVVDTEASRLDQQSENAAWPTFCPSYLKDKNSGGRNKIKRSSSSQLQQLKDGASCSVWKGKDSISSSDDELLDEAEACEFHPSEKVRSVVFRGCDAKASESSVVLPSKAAIQDSHCGNSVAELLDNRQGKIKNLHIKSRNDGKGKGLGQCAVVKNMSSSVKDITSDEDPCEFIHGGSSTDNEDDAQISEHAILELERRTMADKFEEAFGCATVDDRRPFFAVSKPSSTGLFGRLQHMMLQQKEQDAEFLKKVQTEVWPKDEARCIDLKILSRSLDAKLSVCRCSLLENEESSVENPQQDNFGKIWTVIFNPKVCVDVDLEVGNLIRIYPPWKEIQILRGGEIIILAIYFSQIHT